MICYFSQFITVLKAVTGYWGSLTKHLSAASSVLSHVFCIYPFISSLMRPWLIFWRHRQILYSYDDNGTTITSISLRVFWACSYSFGLEQHLGGHASWVEFLFIQNFCVSDNTFFLSLYTCLCPCIVQMVGSCSRDYPWITTALLFWLHWPSASFVDVNTPVCAWNIDQCAPGAQAHQHCNCPPDCCMIMRMGLLSICWPRQMNLLPVGACADQSMWRHCCILAKWSYPRQVENFWNIRW